ncbi:TetR/AcrR family transcriptional regulator [Microbacterium sp. A82]|uniref:TetR/AcrR family transcriptional regulator n=1 Tax=Microbacterium sp. A82 TaxID=3450452 RepID=UPI003F3B2132
MSMQREAVTRDRTLREAVTLADAEGIDAVTMRGLAARFGVVPMALYKHVSSKEDLLSGMIDVLIAEYETPTPGGGWKQEVRRRILSARTVLLRHPWARRVFETRTKRTHAVLAYMDSLSGSFIRGGFSPNLTHHVMHALGHRIWGFSPEAFEDPNAFPLPDDPEERAALVQHVGRAYPNILAIALATSGGDLDGPGCDEDFEFEFALDLLLDAFERLHETGITFPG